MNKDSIISALIFGGGGGSALPAVAGNAGKVLKVNADETGVEWGAGGGDKIYLHRIKLECAYIANCSIAIYSKRSYAYDTPALRQWLYDHGFTTAYEGHPVNGIATQVDSVTGQTIMCYVYSLYSAGTIPNCLYLTYNVSAEGAVSNILALQVGRFDVLTDIVTEI